MRNHDGLAIHGSGAVDTEATRAGSNALTDIKPFLRDDPPSFLDGTDARTCMTLHSTHGISEFLPVLQESIEIFIGVQHVIFSRQCQEFL